MVQTVVVGMGWPGGRFTVSLIGPAGIATPWDRGPRSDGSRRGGEALECARLRET